jgi:hypothetical protein
MNENSIDVWVAFLAAVFGGAGLKLTESILTARQRKNDLLSKTIEQKDKDIESERALRQRADEAASEWREKYWALREDVTEAKEHDGT